MDKKLGNEICPDHQSQGYIRHHNRRNAKSENTRYAGHYTFVHNDRTIKEHYISNKRLPAHHIKDNLNKKEPSEMDAMERVQYALQGIAERFKTFPHNEDDTKRLTSALSLFEEGLEELKAIRFIYHMKWRFDSSHQPMPERLQRAWNLVVQMEKIQEQKAQQLNKLMQKNPEEYDRYLENTIRSNPLKNLLLEIHRIMEKNLGQKQADKFMKRNKLLSESHFGSEKYNKNYKIPEFVHNQKVTRN